MYGSSDREGGLGPARSKTLFAHGLFVKKMTHFRQSGPFRSPGGTGGVGGLSRRLEQKEVGSSNVCLYVCARGV